MKKEILLKLSALFLGILILVFAIDFSISGWSGPTQSPPGANIPTAINTSSTDQSKLGGLGLGGGTGQLLQWLKNISGNLHIKNQAGTSNLFISQDGRIGIGTTDPGAKLEIQGGNLQVTAIPSGTTGTYTPNWNSLQVCQFGTCCLPWRDCDSDGKTYGDKTDCDEGCSTCFIGSTGCTAASDGKDQNCNGIVDEKSSQTASAGPYGYTADCQWSEGGKYLWSPGYTPVEQCGCRPCIQYQVTTACAGSDFVICNGKYWYSSVVSCGIDDYFRSWYRQAGDIYK